MNWPMLAASTGLNEEWWKQVAPSRAGVEPLLVAAGVITFLVLIWAVFIRKRAGERPARYSYPHLNASEKSNGTGSDGSSPSHRRRKRKRKRRRNPTLAETGGLPPIRPEGIPDDPP